MIVFDNVVYSVAGGKKLKNRIFDGVSFSVAPGERVAVLGAKGSGKSTLLNLISGKLRPDSGSIHVKGHVSWPLGQSWGVHQTLTGRQNLNFLIRLRGLSERMAEIAEYFIGFSELGEYFDKPLSAYSNPLKTRFYQSLFFCIPADFYVCDASVGAGDARFKAKSTALLKELVAEKGMFLAHPNENIIREFCISALVLADKTVTYFDSVDVAFEFIKGGVK